MFKKLFKIIINLSLIIASVLCMILVKFDNMSRLVSILLTILPELLCLLTMIFDWLHLKIPKKLCYCLFVVSCIGIICYTILYRLDILDIFSSVNSLKEYILSTKEKGVLIYILIQLLQVIFLPIPASVICIVGSLIYGPILGGIYCCIGVLVGSYISFFIGKVFGYRIVAWIVGKDNVDKYAKIIRTRGVFFLGLAFLLPMFPDDILCFIAGVTNLSIKHFFWITFITRPIGVICMAFFGGGYIIPFSGWGVYAWIGILIVVIVLMIIIFKWQEQIQNFILSKVFRKKRKHNLANKY